MPRFVIQPHERLHDWIAHEKGYFTQAGLDYEITGDGIHGDRTKQLDQVIKKGALEAYEAGKGSKGGERSDISCACHWAVNQAAATDTGRMWGKAYSVGPGAIMVRPDSDIESPGDLAGRPIAVGYHSGSHFATIQSMEPFLAPEELELKFMGYPWQRVDAVLDGDVDAAHLWGLSYYVGEQLGLRKLIDSTFMMGFMFPDHVDVSDLKKYFEALKLAQRDIDFEAERYKHLYLNELPERYHDRVDVRLFGPGERVVFLPYSEDIFEQTQAWMQERGLFDEAPDYDYDRAVVS